MIPEEGRSRIGFLTGVVLMALSLGREVAALEFSLPEKVTDGSRKYRMSRTANGQLATDGRRGLHVTYWSGSELGTTPGNPSYVYYRFRNPDGSWSHEEPIDDSTVGAAQLHIGGRHPSLALTPDGGVWVVWNDHRHCTAAGNWIDNTEIFGDMKPPGGDFSAVDLRLSQTSASHLGDNGFAPKIVSHTDGRMSLSWFDFHFNKDVSDVFLRTSDETGSFDLGASIESMRMTDAAARGNAPAFTVPDMDVDSHGVRRLAWAGGQGSEAGLYYAEAVLGATSVAETLLKAGATDFFDPPHVAVSPSDDVWIAYGDDSIPGGEDVILMRKRSGQSDFDPPFVAAGGQSRQYSADHEVDNEGFVHLVWIDENLETHVYYGVFDPNIPGFVESVRLTQSTGSWIRPSIALDERGKAYVLWEENRAIDEGDLWFATTAPVVTSGVNNWKIME